MAVALIKEDRRKLLMIMEDIVRRCELEALAVVTQANAEEVAFFTDIDTNVDVFCALAAASLDTATKVTNKMNHGSVLELVVLGDTGYTIMSPVADKFILIGAGKDFYSLGKTILILREKVKEIPLTLSDRRPTTTKRKACSHFCQYDDLYCCICSSAEKICDICQTSIQNKQAEQKRILEEALEKAKQLDTEEMKKEENTTFAFTTEQNTTKDSREEGQELIKKVMTKVQNIEEQKQQVPKQKEPSVNAKTSKKRQTKRSQKRSPKKISAPITKTPVSSKKIMQGKKKTGKKRPTKTTGKKSSKRKR